MLTEATEKLKQLLTHMGIVGEVVASEQTDHILLEVRGEETGLVIGKQGATLDALQYIVNRMVAKDLGMGEGRKPIYLDAEGYRQRRAESLTELALRLAEKAKKTGRPVAVDPMSAADRRVMHVALANSPGLTTRSEGEGAQRRLVIIPDAQKE